MRISGFGRYALTSCVAVAMLAGCGGAGAGSGVVPINVAPDHLPNHKSFYYTGGEQTFEVPTGVKQIEIDARGAKGTGSTEVYGGRVRAVIPVVPGETLVVYVGGDASGGSGGFNGGANGGDGGWYCYYRCSGYGGGGSSDIREDGSELTDRILVAGGGGGQGGAGDYPSGSPGGDGGPGGGKAGGAGNPGAKSRSGAGRGAKDGTQHHGGSGGRGGKSPGYGSPGDPGDTGSVGQGGDGGDSYQGCCYPAGTGGGGGGGGYYGGGGGGAGYSYFYGGGLGGGGGGGSSYAERRAKHVHMWQGWTNPAHNGLVVLSW
ncbi:MAG: hypothetical protein WCE97_06560 [Candidatus Cybelea sp.]